MMTAHAALADAPPWFLGVPAAGSRDAMAQRRPVPPSGTLAPGTGRVAAADRWDTSVVQTEAKSDEELVALARTASDVDRRRLLEALYDRHYRRVAGWCYRLCRQREEAAELAQDVFLRVHSRIDTFREESRFTTWLYQVTRSVVLGRLQFEARRRTASIDDDGMAEPEDPEPQAVERLSQAQLASALGEAVRRDLEPTEAKILYLHYVDGLTLPAITDLLRLDNKSGAKAFVVSGRRKLQRRFGRWLSRQSSSAGGRS
jgi:RNA polymerase sigma-70 factor, ECF subfamily